MSLVFNTTVQHIALSDELITTQQDTNDEPEPITKQVHQSQTQHSQHWSSFICYIIPVALVKITGSIVSSSLQLAIPLYAISKYPSHSNTIAGIIITSQGFGVLTSSIFVGRFISLTSDEFCILFSIMLRTLSIISVLIYDHNLIVWIVSSVFFGLSIGSLSISINHILAKYIKTKQRGRVSSTIAGFSRLGRAIGPLYVGYITELRISLLISCTISFLSFFIVCCIMLPPNIAINTINSQDTDGSFIYFKQGWKQTKWKKLSVKNWMHSADKKNEKHKHVEMGMCYVWLKYGKLMLLYGIFGFGLRWVRQTRKMILTFRGDDLSLSNGKIGTINSASFILDSFMFIIAGYVMDKYGRKATAIPGLFLFVVALSTIHFVTNFVELLWIAILFGLADGITVGLMMVSTADLAPAECKSEFISAFKMFTNLPRVLTPVIVGYLCNEVSIFAASVLSAAIGAIALFWIVFVLEDPAKVSLNNNNANIAENCNSDIKMHPMEQNNNNGQDVQDDNTTVLESPQINMLDQRLMRVHGSVI